MRVGLLFYGIARSLRYTIDSIRENIYNVLSDANIDYDIFFHTYKVDGMYTNIRANEKNIKLDNNEYKLLNAKYLIIDNQSDELKRLNVNQYYPRIDPWKNKYASFRNYVLALNSRMKVYNLAESTNNYDILIYLRPDVRYQTKLDIEWLKYIFSNNYLRTILTPSFHEYGGYNDRFAICNMKTGKIYSNVFNYLKLKKCCNSESLLKYCLNDNNIDSKKIKFIFLRIRADGKVAKNDTMIREAS